MFGQKITFLQAAVCGLLMSSHNLLAKVEIKQSEQDLEIRNGKLALNIAKGGPGAVLSYQLEGNLQRAATLDAVEKDAPAATVRTFKLVKDSPELAVVEVEYAFPSGPAVTVAYTIKDNFEYVEAESDFAQGKAAISAAIKSEVLVLPDYLGESMVFYPESAPAETMNIPADNHLLVNLCDQGSSMLALLWDSPKMNISESKTGNLFGSATLSADVKARFWIGALGAKGLWYKAAETLNPDGFTALNWTPPFPAEWKLTTFLDKGFFTDSPTCESWFLIPKDSKKDKEGISPGVVMITSSAWQVWASGLGGFVYPCYLQDNKAFAKYSVLLTGGASNAATPPLICALNGTSLSPSGMTMPQNALQKLLPQDLNNRLMALFSPKHYPPTCGITEEIEKIFFRSESAKEKKKIEEAFVQMNLFVLTVRERIEDYAAWQRKMGAMLNERKTQYPQLAGTADDLNREISQIGLAYAKVKDRMKTPPYCTTLTEKIIALTDANLSDEEKEDQCKELGRQIRVIGGNQDTLLAVFRSIVKAARQDATRKLMMATDSKTKELLENVRAETAGILTGRLGMEGK